MSVIKWDKANDYLEAYGKKIECWCFVRDLVKNKSRRMNEVVRTIPDNLPYNPQVFPVGTWKVERPQARNTKYLAPFFIPTEAKQPVDVWAVTEDGSTYINPTDKKVIDTAYGLHYSTSRSTLGCIRIAIREDLLWLVRKITADMDAGQGVILEVTDGTTEK